MINNIDNLENSLMGALPVFIVSCVFSSILGIILLVSMWKIFKKAGKSGVLSIIPIYNIIVLMEISKMPYVQLLFLLIPIVGPIIYYYKLYSNLSKVFGKSSSFALGLFFLGFVFLPLLAFSDDKYLSSTQGANVQSNQGLDPMEIINRDNGMNSDMIMPQGGVTEIIPVQPVNVYEEQSVVETNAVVSNLEQQPEVNDVSTIETFDVNPVQEPIVVETQTAFNQAPVIETANVNPVQEPIVVETQTAFNQAPVIETANVNPVQEPILAEAQTTFNQAPVMETANVNPVQEPIVVEAQTAFNQAPVMESLDNPKNNQKNCNGCGAEIPAIVSICPKCGFDNE